MSAVIEARGLVGGAEQVLVSAVIPTTGRPSLSDAVRSVLAQSIKSVEAVVVYDGPRAELTIELPSTPRVRVVATGTRQGVAAARSAGVQAARGRYVALLDDDDTWLPNKLAVQLEMAAEPPPGLDHVVLASRVAVVDLDGRPQMIVPRRLIEPRQSVADYLFKRRRIRWGDAVIHPSTLVVERRLAASIPWNDLAIHEDWDWLLRLAASDGVGLLMAGQPLTVVTETRGSASRSANWRGSLAWATSMRSRFSAREWGDLLLCTTAPYARVAEGRRGSLRIGYQALTGGDPGCRR